MSPMRCLAWPTQRPASLASRGHLARKEGITLDLMIGRIHGTRPRTTWLKDLATQANISYKEAITIRRDMKKWRNVGNQRSRWVKLASVGARDVAVVPDVPTNTHARKRYIKTLLKY